MPLPAPPARPALTPFAVPCLRIGTLQRMPRSCVASPGEDSLLARVTDAAWPLSHVFMLVVGTLVLSVGRLTGWRRFPAMISGLAQPLFVGLSALGAPQGVVDRKSRPLRSERYNPAFPHDRYTGHTPRLV